MLRQRHVELLSSAALAKQILKISKKAQAGCLFEAVGPLKGKTRNMHERLVGVEWPPVPGK